MPLGMIEDYFTEQTGIDSAQHASAIEPFHERTPMGTESLATLRILMQRDDGIRQLFDVFWLDEDVLGVFERAYRRWLIVSSVYPSARESELTRFLQILNPIIDQFIP